MKKKHRVARIADLPPGSSVCVDVAGEPVALFNVDGKIYAIGDLCPHADASLTKGLVEGKKVYCPWHGAAFDLETGDKLSNPAPFGVPSYRVEVVAGEVWVEQRK